MPQKEKSSTTETNTKIFKINAALISQINHQLQSFGNKLDEKHNAKCTVLNMASQVLSGKATIAQLNAVIQENPRYKEAMFGSKTEYLVNQALELSKNQLSPSSPKP